MRDLIEGIGYYLSCMILFNGIYGLKIVANGTVFENLCTIENMAGITTLAIAALLVVIGVFFTAQILIIAMCTHGCAAQMCCLFVASSRQRDPVSAKA